nr:MAG TPA: hypothetical protein [Caudoviricetes sp.]
MILDNGQFTFKKYLNNSKQLIIEKRHHLDLPQS